MTTDTTPVVVSDAAGRLRLRVDWLRADSRRAVAIEDAVDEVAGCAGARLPAHRLGGGVVFAEAG